VKDAAMATPQHSVHLSCSKTHTTLSSWVQYRRRRFVTDTKEMSGLEVPSRCLQVRVTHSNGSTKYYVP
jgi:hypothetical protein